MMTDDEFAVLCEKYPDYFIETTAEGEIVIMPPNYSPTSRQSGLITAQLLQWSETTGEGEVTDAAGGFVLPNGARRSPDAAWTSQQRGEELGAQSDSGYWHLAPDFVIELRSQTDPLAKLRRKMQEWIANGTLLAWLIDPERKAVEIYRPGRATQILENVDSVQGESPVEGFTLDLRPVWRKPFTRRRGAGLR